MASGVDQIDVAEIKRRGIALGNTPKVLDDAVADITVGLMIAAARRFKEAVRELERYVAIYSLVRKVFVRGED